MRVGCFPILSSNTSGHKDVQEVLPLMGFLQLVFIYLFIPE